MLLAKNLYFLAGLLAGLDQPLFHLTIIPLSPLLILNNPKKYQINLQDPLNLLLNNPIFPRILGQPFDKPSHILLAHFPTLDHKRLRVDGARVVLWL